MKPTHQNAFSRPARRTPRGDYLDRLNEKLAERDTTKIKILHPTKGFRRISPKRLMAQQVIEMIHGGTIGVDTAKIAAIVSGRPL